MSHKFLALIALLALSLSAAAKDAGVPQAHPFSVSSLNTAFAVQGDFEGEYRIYPGQIILRLTKADIRISEHCPYKGRNLLSSVKFGLATSTGDKRWKIAHAGQEFFLERVMKPGDTQSLGELYFYIPIDDSVDLSKHWLVAEIEGTAMDVAAGTRRKGYSYAHSCRDIFTRPK